MAVDVATFTNRLVSSGLMTELAVEEFLQTLPIDLQPQDGHDLGKRLMQAELLTQFQISILIHGKNCQLLLGDYIILDRISTGGMGEIYRARRRSDNLAVALKILPQKATNSENAVQRFYREMQVFSKLRHPNVVQSLDSGVDNGIPYLVMEFIEGSDLSRWIKNNGPLSLPEAVDFLLQASSGLMHAHSQGVIHRDVKPSNFMVDSQGAIKILDLGLARLIDSGEVLTHTGHMMGTVDFMAPEQAFDAKQADQRADVYGLGCTFYFLLTGKTVYDGPTMIKRALAHRDQPIPALRATVPEASPEIEHLFQRAIAKKPEDRFQSMADFHQECLHAGIIPRRLDMSNHRLSGPAVSTFPVNPGTAQIVLPYSATGPGVQAGAVLATTSEIDESEAPTTASPPKPAAAAVPDQAQRPSPNAPNAAAAATPTAELTPRPGTPAGAGSDAAKPDTPLTALAARAKTPTVSMANQTMPATPTPISAAPPAKVMGSSAAPPIAYSATASPATPEAEESPLRRLAARMAATAAAAAAANEAEAHSPHSEPADPANKSTQRHRPPTMKWHGSNLLHERGESAAPVFNPVSASPQALAQASETSAASPATLLEADPNATAKPTATTPMPPTTMTTTTSNTAPSATPDGKRPATRSIAAELAAAAAHLTANQPSAFPAPPSNPANVAANPQTATATPIRRTSAPTVAGFSAPSMSSPAAPASTHTPTSVTTSAATSTPAQSAEAATATPTRARLKTMPISPAQLAANQGSEHALHPQTNANAANASNSSTQNTKASPAVVLPSHVDDEPLKPVSILHQSPGTTSTVAREFQQKIDRLRHEMPNPNNGESNWWLWVSAALVIIAVTVAVIVVLSF